MLRHIVMIKYKDEVDLSEVSKILKSMLINLKNSIDALIDIEVGMNISTRPSAYDIVLTADFKDEKGLDLYRIHPEHVKVLDYLKIVMDSAVVVDYVI